MITIRNYERKDASVTWELKFQTIRNINISDYSLEQVKAWAPDNFDMDVWQKRIDDMNPFVAELNGQVVASPIYNKMAILIIFFLPCRIPRSWRR